MFPGTSLGQDFFRKLADIKFDGFIPGNKKTGGKPVSIF
jgi:hypothetical protein